MDDTRLPAGGGHDTSVTMSDKRWEQVIAALRKTGTKRDAALADRIDKPVQFSRRREAARQGR